MLLDRKAINLIVQSSYENKGIDLVEISYNQPIMLFFLRHFGCTFCRQALSDISAIQDKITALGVQVVYVHMVDKETADIHLSSFNLSNSTHISDPEKELYAYFGLQKGSFRQLYGLSVMMTGIKAGLINGHGHGFKAIGDMEQMPGLFIIDKGKVIRKYIHQLSSDRPDYLEFIELALMKEE